MKNASPSDEVSVATAKDITLSAIGKHTQKSKEINIEATVTTVSNK